MKTCQRAAHNAVQEIVNGVTDEQGDVVLHDIYMTLALLAGSVIHLGSGELLPKAALLLELVQHQLLKETGH